MFYNKRIILIYARFLYKSFSISFDITMCECIFACLSFSLCVYVRRSKSTSHRSLFYYIINFFPIQFLWAFIRSMFDFPLLRLYRKLNVLINVCVCVFIWVWFFYLIVYLVMWMCMCMCKRVRMNARPHFLLSLISFETVQIDKRTCQQYVILKLPDIHWRFNIVQQRKTM